MYVRVCTRLNLIFGFGFSFFNGIPIFIGHLKPEPLL